MVYKAPIVLFLFTIVAGIAIAIYYSVDIRDYRDSVIEDALERRALIKRVSFWTLVPLGTVSVLVPSQDTMYILAGLYLTDTGIEHLQQSEVFLGFMKDIEEIIKVKLQSLKGS